jgi:hypothetical protein
MNQEVEITADKFPLGHVVATPGALEKLEELERHPIEFLSRHAAGDWGDLSQNDARENEFALTRELRLFSSYKLNAEDKIWIITEADRSATTILLPDEY